MTIDTKGNLDPKIDEVTPEAPSSPEHREGASMWIWDDAGRFGLPRIAVEALGATWETSRTTTLNFGEPDGRLLLSWDAAPPHPATDEAGRPRVLGAGALKLQCVEPFEQWRLTFDGKAAETSAKDMIAGRGPSGAELGDAANVSLAIEIKAQMVAPPWFQGTQNPEGQFVVGEHRFEQLFTANGTVSIDGATTPFDGGGLRIHRKGGNRSDYSDWYGHSWQSAKFPSGRAFGYIHYRPRPDGSVKYHEGWVLDGGEVLPARVVETPWMKALEPRGEEVSFTLRTPKGDYRIESETHLSTFFAEREMSPGVTFPPLQQGIARYRWDGEEVYGMIERSARL